jgi:ectoine hydroxylase-related dioxygenase (phytanoyl-CoA dioxygenase family)
MRRVARASGGNDLRWTSAYVSIKDPRSGALWWHQDWWCWDHPVSYRREAAQIALLCYLQDTTVRTGALRVLPGSHTASTRLHGVLPEAHRDPHAVSTGNVALEDQPDQVTLELRAGDAVLLDYRLLHGTHPNASACRRDCLILNFTPSWRGLPDDIRSHLIAGFSFPHEANRADAEAVLGQVLPSYDGIQRDLDLTRDAPAAFACDT